MIALALWLSGVSAAARRLLAGRGRFVLELHGVASRPYPGLPRSLRPRLAAADLERILTWVGTRFTFLSPEELLTTARPGVLLSFDDGFANNHEVVLPRLRRHRAPAVFFVATGHLGGGRRLGFVEAAAAGAALPLSVAHDLLDGMGEAQLRECAGSGLVTLGAHSVSHPRLTELDDAQLAVEVAGSKAQLEELSGAPVELFAYPFGDADARVARAVAAAGFRAAFVEGRLPIEPPHLAIPRVGIHGSRPWYLAAKLSGLHERPLEGRVLAP
jgi:peptidoglycan/xylan/chitin deacetylase (PgdA/CDA1 family)